jgi:hypothetical protein
VLSQTPDLESLDSSTGRRSSSEVHEQDAVVVNFRDSVARESVSGRANPLKQLVATTTHKPRGKEMKVKTSGVAFYNKEEGSLGYNDVSPTNISAHIVC